MEQWELEASEAIRRTITAYNFATDRGAFEDVAECFTENGVLELASGERVTGRAAIVSLLEGVGPNADRSDNADGAATPSYVHHHVTNVHFRSLMPSAADVSCYFLVLTAVGTDHWGRYRDRLVRSGDGRWLFEHRLAIADGYAPHSRFLRERGA
ncbi:MAG: nuclear transport factor 2 family protein [Acidimicrobiia bacterium]